MITSLEIENFKSIGSPGVRIELRPITLLFGANSAGKSTIIHALHYLRHLVLYESGDVDRTDHATGELDLGGFRRLVHQRDLSRSIRIRIEHTRKTFLDLWLWENFIEPQYPTGGPEGSEEILKGLLDSLAMEVEVRWSHIKGAPYISVYRVFLNGLSVAEVTSDPDKNFIQMKGGGFEQAFDEKLTGHASEEMLRGIVQDMDQYASAPVNRAVADIIGAMSNPLSRVIPDPKVKEIHWLAPESSQLEYMGDEHQRGIFHMVSALVIGPSYLTYRELAGLHYIGPIRDIPPRDLREISSDNDLSWNRGAAAWNMLFKQGSNFTNEVGEWLGDSDRLDTGYSVTLKNVVELSDDLMMARILDGEDYSVLDDLRQKLRETPGQKRVVFIYEETGFELAPSEVGTGLSEIVPVVVAALDPARRFVAIEQPELHVHPKVQVGLADLFIRGIGSQYDEDGENALNSPPIFLIETHSEHMMLRLLRRIEETIEGEIPTHLRAMTPVDLSVNYIYRDKTTRQTKVVPLRIDAKGEFMDRWPDGFFGERADELFR